MSDLASFLVVSFAIIVVCVPPTALVTANDTKTNDSQLTQRDDLLIIGSIITIAFITISLWKLLATAGSERLRPCL
jgi:nitrate reductase NapE component